MLQDAREGRKNNIRIALSSQAVEDFGDDILEAATSVFVFDAPSNRSIERLAGNSDWAVSKGPSSATS